MKTMEKYDEACEFAARFESTMKTSGEQMEALMGEEEKLSSCIEDFLLEHDLFLAAINMPMPVAA